MAIAYTDTDYQSSANPGSIYLDVSGVFTVPSGTSMMVVGICVKRNTEDNNLPANITWDYGTGSETNQALTRQVNNFATSANRYVTSSVWTLANPTAAQRF